MTDDIKIETSIEDYTTPDIYRGFLDAVFLLTQDAKWQIDRESSRPPLHGPIHVIDGQTIQHNPTMIYNGYLDISDIPKSDYLKTDFSNAAQFDKLSEITQRFVHACLRLRESHHDQLIWSNRPSILVRRQLHRDGLLLLVSGRCSWRSNA